MEYLQLEPARAKRKDPEPLWEDRSFIAETKYDGWRFLMHTGTPCSRMYLTGRRASRVTGLFSEKGLLVPGLSPVMPPTLRYTVFDGEILPPDGAGFRDIAGLMNSEPEKVAKRIAEIGHPRYVVFDILFYDGEDVRGMMLIDRKKIMVEALRRARSPHIDMIVHQEVDKRGFYDEICARGGEGVIFKDISSPYGEGWIKVKKTHTIDVVITGFTDARMGVSGKYLGLIGAARVSVYGPGGGMIEVGKVSGMSDDIRIHMTENKSSWLGSVIEVEVSGWAKDRLWHPRYRRTRPDADPRSCTYSKMMRDMALSTDRDEKQLQLF